MPDDLSALAARLVGLETRLATVEFELGRLRDFRHTHEGEAASGFQLIALLKARVDEMWDQVKALRAEIAELKSLIVTVQQKTTEIDGERQSVMAVVKPVAIALILGFVSWVVWMLLQLYHLFPHK